MPARSRVSADFATAVKDAIGARSQSEVALSAQISVGYVNRMVRGGVPSESVILRLADGLGIDAKPLLEAAGYLDEVVSKPPRTTVRRSQDPDSLGPMAAVEYLRELFDSKVKPAFPDAALPSTSSLPLTRTGVRNLIVELFRELLEEDEDDSAI